MGTGVAAKYGILIKGGSALEKAYKIKTIVFDKTGTLTQGKPVVTNLKVFSNIKQDEFLKLVASIESCSSHPLAKCLVEYCSSVS